MKFKGYLLDKPFDLTEAESPSDLYRCWKSDGDPPIENVRCWVHLKTPSSYHWIEVILDMPASFFERMKDVFDDCDNGVSIEFRAKGTPSPNSSPRTAEPFRVTEGVSALESRHSLSTPKAGKQMITVTLQKAPGVKLGLTLSEMEGKLVITKIKEGELVAGTALEEGMELYSINDELMEGKKSLEAAHMLVRAHGALTIVAIKVGEESESNKAVSSGTKKEIDSSKVVNDKDPFTMEHVVKTEDPILLRFPNDHVLCVSLNSLEQFVREETNAGKNLFGLELPPVPCKGGRELSFVISKSVWMLSLLEQPLEIRKHFRGYLECAITREEQLQGLKEDKELWERVLFWVSDFLDFNDSHERLSLPPQDGITPFMSPYYFSEEEAKILGSLVMPNTTVLHKTILVMLEKKAGEGALEVCASHDIAPVLFIGFEIKKGFHKQEKFKKEKKMWIKKRDKAMSKSMKG